MTRGGRQYLVRKPGGFRPDGLKRLITARLVAEIIQYLTGKSLTEANVYSQYRNLDRWLYEESLRLRILILDATFH